MKTQPFINMIRSRQRQTAAGWTIMEFLVASAIFMIVMGSILVLAVYSMRLSSGVSRQLELNTQANVVNLMVYEIKKALTVNIQTYNGTTLTTIAANQPLQGNALALVVPSGSGTVTNQVIYWVDTNGNLFRKVVSANMTKLWIDDVTSSAPFKARDYTGAILTVPNSRMLVEIVLTAQDSNTRDFKQTVTRQVTVNNRN